MSIDISRLGKAAQAQILKQLRENEKRRIEREQVEYQLLPAVYELEGGAYDGAYFETCLKTKKEAEKAAGQKLKLVERGVSYVADFVYQKDGHTVVEDAKGYKNTSAAIYRVFVIKRKLMFGKYGIRVREV